VDKIKKTILELQKAGCDVELSEGTQVFIEGVPFKLVRLKEDVSVEDRGLRFKPISVTESVE